MAEFRNLQERTRREVEAARQFAIQRFAADLIESVDNFERALGAVPREKVQAAQTDENKDLLELYSGLRMTEDVLLKTLKKHGLERFDPSELVEGQAQKFDPTLHEATFMAPAEGKNDGEVMHTQTKGFTLNGRVLRVSKLFSIYSLLTIVASVGSSGMANSLRLDRPLKSVLSRTPNPPINVRLQKTMIIPDNNHLILLSLWDAVVGLFGSFRRFSLLALNLCTMYSGIQNGDYDTVAWYGALSRNISCLYTTLYLGTLSC